MFIDVRRDEILAAPEERNNSGNGKFASSGAGHFPFCMLSNKQLAARGQASCKLIRLSSELPDHHFLFRIVESHSLPRMHRRDRHADRSRVVIAGNNIRMRRLAAADAFHPIAHVR